jgi:carbon-monoxide dehydrogenase medium subunit
MQVTDLEVHEASTLEEAAALLGRHGPDARLLAGGTDLLVDLRTGRVKARHAISISAIDELHGVTRSDGALRIGALTTLDQLHEAVEGDEPFAVLGDAIGQMAAPQVRNLATVGGNIAGAVPCADLPPVLIVLGAVVELWSPAGTRSVTLEDVHTGPRETILRADEVLAAVVVPEPPRHSGAAYARFSLRGGNAIAVAGVAAWMALDAAEVVTGARVALSAVAPTPLPAPEAAEALIGRRLDEDALAQAAEAAVRAARPITDLRGSAEYRREIVGVLTRRALAEAHRRAGG